MTYAPLAAALLAAAPRLVTEADLAPLLEGSAAEGAAAFQERRYEEAASRLARDARPEARFLRALALAEAGRRAEAVEAARGLEVALPDLADRVCFLRAQALDAVGRHAEAAAAYAAVPDGSLLAPQARLARARLLQAGDRAAALDALAPLLSIPAPLDLSRPDPTAEALLLAGRLRAAGRPADGAGARAAFLACWTGHPMAPEAGDCYVAARALPGKDGERPAPQDVLPRAEALLDYNRADLAVAQLRTLLPGLPEAGADEPFACRVRSALGRAYRRERMFGKSIELLRPVADRCQDPTVRARALFVLAGAVAAAGERSEAIALYRRLARQFPAHALADDALFAAADLLARDGEVAQAGEAFGAIARDYADGDRRDEARFRLAWLAKRQGEVDAAVAQLLAIEEDARDRDPYEHARAGYWRARLLSTRGEAGRGAARAIWSELAARYPADYYGLVSRARLAELAGGDGDGLPPPVTAPPPEEARYDPGPLPEDRHFRAGVTLLRIGLAHLAADELNAVDQSRLRPDVADPVLLLADLLDRAGDARASSALLRSLARGALRKPPEGQNLRVWHIAYPKAYREQVERWAPPARVPVDLLQALMREESALDPRAVSPAGAVGLTQLMLPTARQVARSLGLPRPTRGDLTAPAISIRIGARLLGDLIRRFDGSVSLALASYNAGPNAVAHWLAERGGLDLDEFVEEIPIEETRGYVKRVLRSYAAYRLLYGAAAEEALDLRLPLPRS
ncbi:MAG TPA: lytic transglycosylase domain-containing protein [Anaeromyxobacteraceae bacterium]|nr:lytic transglycosylase domain-containing protein [Anaeromyxobacteraceae bacterium]